MPSTDPIDAVSTAVPDAIPRTTPALSTVTMPAALEFHSAIRCTSQVAFSSSAAARTTDESPTRSATVSGKTRIAVTTPGAAISCATQPNTRSATASTASRFRPRPPVRLIAPT